MKSAGGMEQNQFAMPVQQVTVMVVVLALVLAGSFMAYGFVEPIFLANRYLNGVILGVFFVGILACFWQVLQIAVSVIWFEKFREGDSEEPELDVEGPSVACAAGRDVGFAWCREADLHEFGEIHSGIRRLAHG